MSVSEPPDEPDAWAQVAVAAAQAARDQTHCPACGKWVLLSEHNAIKIHFAKAVDLKPCAGSWKRICAWCQKLLHAPAGNLVHLDDGAPACAESDRQQVEDAKTEAVAIVLRNDSRDIS